MNCDVAKHQARSLKNKFSPFSCWLLLYGYCCLCKIIFLTKKLKFCLKQPIFLAKNKFFLARIARPTGFSPGNKLAAVLLPFKFLIIRFGQRISVPANENFSNK